MTVEEMIATLMDVRYKDWEFLIIRLRDYAYLQVRFVEEDIVSGIMELQKGRKWLLSEHMTRSEIVQTAFKAVLTVVEHEVREEFKYCDRAIYGPHFDVDKLYDLAIKSNLDLRREHE